MALQPSVGPTMARAEHGPEVTSPAVAGETGGTSYYSGHWDHGAYGCPTEDPYWYGAGYRDYPYGVWDETQAQDQPETVHADAKSGDTAQGSQPMESADAEFEASDQYEYGYDRYGYDEYSYYRDHYPDYYCGYEDDHYGYEDDFYTYEPYDYETEYWQDDQSAADEASTHEVIDQAGETQETTDEQSGPDQVSTHEYTRGHDDYGYGCYGYDDYGYGCYGDYYADYYANYYTGYYGDGSEQSAPAAAGTEQADDDLSDVHTYEEAEIVDRYGYWDGRAEAPVEELPAPPGPDGFRESDDQSFDTADAAEDGTLREDHPESYYHGYGYDGYGYDGYGYGEYYYEYDYDAYHDAHDPGADPDTDDTSDHTAEGDAQDAGAGAEDDHYCEYGCYYEYGCYCDAYHHEYDVETADMADAASGDGASTDAETDDTPNDTTEYDYYGKYGYYDEYGYYGEYDEYYHDAYHYEYDTDVGADGDTPDTADRSARYDTEQYDAEQYDGYCEYGYYDEYGYPYGYYDGYEYRYEYPYEYVTEPGAPQQTAEESFEPSETPEQGPFIDDLDPFTWHPRDLLQTADGDLLRTLNGLFEERASVRELALNEYIEGLGLHAVEFVARFEEAFGHEALMLHDDLPGVAALLATYRMIERGELGMNDGVDILRRHFNHLSPQWIEEVSLIVTELPERSVHHAPAPCRAHGEVVRAVLSASARSLGSIGSDLTAALSRLTTASGPLAAIGDGWPAPDVAAVHDWIAR